MKHSSKHTGKDLSATLGSPKLVPEVLDFRKDAPATKLVSRGTILTKDSTEELAPRKSIDEIADYCAGEGMNLNAFTLAVVHAGYSEKEFNDWIESKQAE